MATSRVILASRCWSAAAIAAAGLAGSPCHADSTTRVQGTWSEYTPGNSVQFTFSCVGTPTCSGTFFWTFTYGPPFATCNPTLTASFGGAVTITGLDLSHPGNLQGNVQLSQDALISQAGSTCRVAGYQPHTRTYTASWNGSTGTNLVVQPDYNYPNAGLFTASTASAPVFPMNVTADVTPTNAYVATAVQPRPQDVGKNASVYVFAHAPSSLVSGAHPAKRDPGDHAPASPSDDSIVCVLAQVTPSGQLVAVSASTMQAYLTGVLGAQSQAVQVLNNVSTPNIAGVTMYVGYGSSAQDMLSSGVFQAAVSVPNGVQCLAKIDSAPAPKTPGPLTGLWWNPHESGWGVHFTQRSNVVVATWYTYDAAGNPKWYIAPNCTGPSGVSGTCTGAVYEVNGPHFFGADFVPITASEVSQAGNLSVAFADANNASMTFTVAGVARTIPITRQVFDVAQTSPPAIDYTDLWWNPNQSGWGLAITQQYANIFLAWYVYDANGKPVWYVASNCVVSGSSCSGTLYRTTGPVFATSFDPTQVQVFTVGSAIVSFVDANNAVLSYIVDGVPATKTITRQIFP
ncbi:MAG TPA: hypothetical protein VLT89_01685 [Usitatibacter sp.]|nr:hypothetical protein [Usitatibacter sp.]